MGKERQTDAAGYGDSTFAVVRGPDGQVKQEVGPNDPEEYPTAPGVAVPSGESYEHPNFGEVKGPDPEEWAERDEAVANTEQEASFAAPLGIGEVRNEGEEDQVKGPSEQWRQDEEGGYVNRG